MLTPSHSSISSPPPWDLGEVALAFVLGYFVTPLLLSRMLFPAYAHWPLGQKLLITQLLTLAAWGVILAVFHRRYGSRFFQDIGLVVSRPWLQLLNMGLLCAVGMLIVGSLLGGLSSLFGWPVKPPDAFFPHSTPGLMFFLGVFLAPILEETTVRGLLQTALLKHLSPPLAIATSACIFMMLHSLYYGHWMALSYVFLLGVLLGTVRYFSGSLIPGMTAHLLNNLAAIVLFWH